MSALANKWLVAAAMFALLPYAALADTPNVPIPARPTTVIEPKNCVTSECHGDVRDYPVVHGPVAQNACDACHELENAGKHTFKVTREKADLCTFCHEFNTGKKPVVHAPVKRGECLGCHNPHGGMTHGLTREDSVANLCARCHESTLHDKKFVHTPVKDGACDTCHTPHASTFPKLLDAVGTDLCLTCHTDFDQRMAKAPFRHKAIDEGCDKCHDAHGSAFPMAVRLPINEMCLSCHDKIKERAAQAYDKHSVIASDRACLTCHTAHGGNLARLMADVPAKICMTCHNEKIEVDETHTVAAVKEISDPATFKHGPIREGQCGGCHSVHGSDHALLLDKAYSSTFYQRFKPGKYELCLKCHDARLIQDPAGKSAFRNGEQNLHYVHVIQDVRGHNCTNCHDNHAGANDRIVRDHVTYGKWQMPIGFTRTETGGSCNTGCHLTWSYDRDNPFVRDNSAPGSPATADIPGTQPAPTARAAKDEPTLVSFLISDVDGTQVHVPDADRPTVLLFIGPEQRQREQVFKQVVLAVPDAARARVIVIVCGPAADEQAATMIRDKVTPWTVVSDAGYSICGELAVHGWPTTMIIRSDGLQIARIGGAPESLAIRLPAYIDFAAGKTVDPAATQPASIRNGADSDIFWHVQMARKLLDDDKPQRANKILAEALKANPDAVPLRAAMIETLARLHRGDEAAALLEALPPKALPPAERHLLSAKVLLAQDRRDDAKAALIAAAQADPTLREVHYRLGLIYEEEKDWQRAAQSFRALHEASAE